MDMVLALNQGVALLESVTTLGLPRVSTCAVHGN